MVKFAYYSNELLTLFFTLFIVMDPIGLLPQFLSLTGYLTDNQRKKVIRKSILVAGSVILVFILFGRILLHFFGITPGAFYISGGILFFMISIEMIYNKPRSRDATSSTNTDAISEESTDPSMIAVFPLAIPLIAGPGTLTNVIIFVTRQESWLESVVLLLIASGLCLLIEYVVLKSSKRILALIGRTGLIVLEKIMGLILAGFSIQLVYDGLQKLGILK